MREPGKAQCCPEEWTALVSMRASSVMVPPPVRCEKRQHGHRVSGSGRQRASESCIGGTHKDHQVCKRRDGSGPRRALTFTRSQAGRPTSPAANGIRVVHQHEDGHDAGPDDPAISAAAGRPPRGMRSGAHRARADEGMQAHGCSSSPKFRLAACQRSSGRFYVGGIKSVETSIQGVHAKNA